MIFSFLFNKIRFLFYQQILSNRTTVQFGFAHPLGVAIRRRFYLPSENGSNHLHHEVTIGIDDNLSYSDDNNKKMPIQAHHIGKSSLVYKNNIYVHK